MSPNSEKPQRAEVRSENEEVATKSIKDMPNRVIKQIYHLGFVNEASYICRNAIPLAIGNLSQMLFTMMSLFFCGHVGTNELAAVALANTVIGSF
jgi:Na+-driven multidrug efflux pump